MTAVDMHMYIRKSESNVSSHRKGGRGKANTLLVESLKGMNHWRQAPVHRSDDVLDFYAQAPSVSMFPKAPSLIKPYFRPDTQLHQPGIGNKHTEHIHRIGATCALYLSCATCIASPPVCADQWPYVYVASV